MDASPVPEYLAYLRKSNGRKPIPRQRALTRGHVEQLGGRITAEFSDADSTAFRRPGEARPPRKDFDRMLSVLASAPGVGVAAWHADRLTRDSEDTESLIRVCAAGRNPVETWSGGRYDLWNATGRKRLRDDATAAAYEVDHNRERILGGRLEAAQEGRWLGGKRPFGWELDRAPRGEDGEPLLDDDGHPVKGILRLVPAEAGALAQAHLDVLEGRSLRSIAREWNEAGLTGTHGMRWNTAEVGRVLRRARNAGLMEYQGAITGAAAWPAITDEGTWRAVRALLDDPGRRTTTGGTVRHLLSFLALCGVCEGPVIASNSGGNNRVRRAVYRCRRDTRGHVTRNQAETDAMITDLVIRRLDRADAGELLREDTAPELAELERDKTATEALMREENDLRKRRLLTAAEFAESRAEHLAGLERISARIADLSQADVLAPLIGRAAQAWPGLDADRRRIVIARLMTVTILTAPKGRRPGWKPGESYFDPDTVKVEWKDRRGARITK